MAELVYDKDGKAFEIAFDRTGKQVLIPARDEIRETRPTEKPLWQFETPMSVLQEGPSVEGVLGALPAVGGIVGGAIGGGVGVSGGPSVIPAAVGGAAIGGAVGETAKNVGRWAVGAPVPDAFSQAVGVLKEAGSQGVQELVGQGIGRVVQGAAAPGRGSLDPAMIAAQERLRRSPAGAGLDLPASSLTKSRPVAYLEGSAAEGWGGGAVADRFRSAAGKLTAIADDTVARASTLTSDAQRGEAMAGGMKAFKDAWMQTKTQLWADYLKDRPGGAWTWAPDTASLVRSAVKEKISARRVMPEGPISNDRFFRGLLEGFHKIDPKTGKITGLKKVRISDLSAAIDEIEKLVEVYRSQPFAGGEKSFLIKLAGTMERELKGALGRVSPDVLAKYELANTKYREGFKKINSAFGEVIHKQVQEGNFDLIPKMVANSRMSVSQIPAIKEVLGTEGTEAMQASVLASLVERASTHAEGGEKVLTAKGLDAAGKAFGWERLEALLTPDQFQRYMDLTKARGSMQRGERVIFGSPTAGKAQVAGYKALAADTLKSLARPFIGFEAAKTAMGGPAWGMAYVLGDVGFNKFLGSKIGQKWATTGFPRLGAWAGGASRQVPRVVYGMQKKETE